jgi:LEA14-like dessication related protein
MENLSFTEGTFVFQFQITNPNPVGFSVSRVNYDLELNGRSFIKGDLPKGIQLPSRGSASFEVPVTLEYFKFFKTLNDFIGLDEIPYELKGSVTAGPFQIPFSKTGHFDRPDLPRISLKSIHVSKLSLAGASMVIKLSLRNANAFPVDFAGLDYDIRLSNVSIAKGSANVLDPIKENGEVELKLPIDVGFLNLGRSAYELLKNSSVNYSVSGHLKSKSKDGKTWSFPIEKSGQVSITR